MKKQLFLWVSVVGCSFSSLSAMEIQRRGGRVLSTEEILAQMDADKERFEADSKAWDEKIQREAKSGRELLDRSQIEKIVALCTGKPSYQLRRTDGTVLDEQPLERNKKTLSELLAYCSFAGIQLEESVRTHVRQCLSELGSTESEMDALVQGHIEQFERDKQDPHSELNRERFGLTR